MRAREAMRILAAGVMQESLPFAPDLVGNLSNRVAAVIAAPLENGLTDILSLIDSSRHARAAGDIGSAENSLDSARRYLAALLGLEDK